MLQLIIGEKGKGKTKILLDKVNTEIKTANGNIVYLDKDTANMYDLNNKIRLIDVSSYDLANSDEFVGFISGIISQDHDLEQMYFDSFLKLACISGDQMNAVLSRIKNISDKYNIKMVVSVSAAAEELSDELKQCAAEA